MSFPRYESYRDSGVEWIGEVPSHWKVSPIKSAFRVVGGSTPKSDIEDYWDGDVPWITPADLSQLDGFELYSTQRMITLAGLESCGTTLVPNNTVVLSTRAPIGSIGITTVSACTNQGCKSLVTKGLMNSRLLAYLLSMATDELRIRGKGTTFLELSSDELGAFHIPVPPVNEQTATVEFLDRETAKIDALVETQRRLIELLKEKRQAVISHAVTKGLDPTVPMKDSDVQWIGGIPEHWSLRRLKQLSPAITVGIVVNPSEYISEEGRPFIYGGDIIEGRINFEGSRRISPELSKRQAKTMLKAGDLLTVRVGAPGITAVVPAECEGGNCASVLLIRQGGWSSRWLCYAMNSPLVRFQVQVVQYGAAQEQFNVAHAVEFVIPTPPLAEAEEIADHLDNKCCALDALTLEARSAIDLLRKRRSTLISAAVTGKIDVRGLAPAASDAEAA